MKQFSETTKRLFAQAFKLVPNNWVNMAVLQAKIRSKLNLDEESANTLLMMLRVMEIVEEDGIKIRRRGNYE